MSLESKEVRIVIVAVVMLLIAYYSVFGVGQQHDLLVGQLPPSEIAEEKEWKTSKHSEGAIKAPVTGEVEQRDGIPYLTPTFGYNKKRNVERWTMIYTSMAADKISDKEVSVVDYGADEGYFSISTSFAFQQATVIALDMGGFGGSIWKSSSTHDVLTIQSNKIKEYGRGDRMSICQTSAKPEHFASLLEKGSGHDYQFVLSVFHWFEMPDRESFEIVLVNLLSNAKTTFIELPIAGDFGPRFMKQVGSKNFVKWYDGRSDIQQIISDSLKARGAVGTVTKVGSVKWLPGDKKKGEKDWDRELFRVDMNEAPASYSCDTHFSVYGCSVPTKPNPVPYSRCPDTDSD
eukprot:TRINITY_DN3933_c0_g1_i4.p1 TRINITY_DN3933_c0_g1~~TRINITY_DN3933_c0_g1_i4.p1  ORF type:complete len:346 (+),score=59.63 TRINITY_DN3933_c0_g1_i4:114-1151(+)